MTDKMKDGVIRRGSTWSYVVRERDAQTGKSRPRWVGGFPTRKAAKDARDGARNAVNRGTFVPPQDLKVGAWLDRWIVAHEVELKPSTAQSYRGNIERYLRPAIGEERVQALSPSRLGVLFRELHEHGGKGGRPLSAGTVAGARAVLRRAMNDAVVDRLIEVNPVSGSKVPKRDGKPKHATWTGEQLAKFLGHAADTRWAPLWELAAATGMRRGELMGLRWGDVDLDAGVISVERSTTQLKIGRVTTTPKNHQRRQVAIDPHTVAAVKAWRVKQAAERLEWGAAYEDVEGLVFTWENGSPVFPDYVSKAFGKAQAGADLPRINLHAARHSHATMLLRAGVPVHIVAKRLGHKDPSVTLNVYADAIPEDDNRAVDVFSEAVWGA
jgi:integrase